MLTGQKLDCLGIAWEIRRRLSPQQDIGNIEPEPDSNTSPGLNVLINDTPRAFNWYGISCTILIIVNAKLLLQLFFSSKPLHHSRFTETACKTTPHLHVSPGSAVYAVCCSLIMLVLSLLIGRPVCHPSMSA